MLVKKVVRVLPPPLTGDAIFLLREKITPWETNET